MANCRDHNHRFMYAIDALLIVIAVIISSALANLKKDSTDAHIALAAEIKLK